MDVDAKNIDGETPGHLAVRYKQVGIQSKAVIQRLRLEDFSTR